MGGGRDLSETANTLGLPAELVAEAEDFRHASNEIYPDNVQTVNAFRDMLTQWRVGPCGATGLDYNALPVVLRMRGVKRSDQEDIFDGVRIMERAALKVIRRD